MKILNYFKSVLKRPQKDSESIFYENLFIENIHWNTPEPNDEEALRWDIIKSFLHHLQINEGFSIQSNILDLGCGRGWLTNLLSDFGNVKGIEPVSGVVKYAKSLFPKQDIIAGDSKTLLRSNKNLKNYDLIVASEVIEHIEDVDKNDFVNDINMLLKEKGYVIITTPRKEAEIDWLKYSNPNQPIEDWMTEQNVEELFLHGGFIPLQKMRFSIPPTASAPLIEIYQLWLFKRK